MLYLQVQTRDVLAEEVDAGAQKIRLMEENQTEKKEKHDPVRVYRGWKVTFWVWGA